MTYRVKDEYVLKTVAGEHIVVPVGSEAVKFHGMISLNETGMFLFSLLKEKKTLEDLVRAVLDEYEINVELAYKDVLDFIEKLDEHRILEHFDWKA